MPWPLHGCAGIHSEVPSPFAGGSCCASEHGVLCVRLISKCASGHKEASTSEQCAANCALLQTALCNVTVTLSWLWVDFAVKKKKKQQIRSALCFSVCRRVTVMVS